MIRGRFIGSSVLSGLSTNTVSRDVRFAGDRGTTGHRVPTRQRDRQGSPLGRRERAHLVSADGFLRQQGGRELSESLTVATEQLASAGFGPCQERGDFLVD